MIFPAAEEALLAQGDDDKGEKRQKAPPQSGAGSTPVAFMVNAYNGKLYFSQSGKLIAYDLSTGENQILCESKFISLRSDPYIVDDTWVYFVSGSSTLWRVSNRGGKPQRIFG